MNQSANVHPINESVKVNPSTTPNTVRTQKAKPTEVLPTNRMTFEKQINLLRAYANAYSHFGRAVTVREVADVANMLPDTMSTANAFFLDVGLLQKNDTKFTPSNELIAFNHAYQWNPESASLKLLPLFENTWFAKRILPKLLMSNLSEEEAVTDLAAASSATPGYKSSIKILLDYLNEVGLIKRDNGMIIRNNILASNNAPIQEESTSKVSHQVIAPMVEPAKEAQRPSVPPMNQMTAGTIQFSINIKVDMTEFAGWDAERIGKFFAGIAQVLAAKAAVEQSQ